MTGWTQQQFIDRFRIEKIIAASDMPWDQFRKMSDNDLKAIYQYLNKPGAHQECYRSLLM